MDHSKDAIKYIEANSDKYIDISHKIWGYAELSLKEYKSAALYIEALKAEGFDVSENLGGIPTAFSGSFGSGKPVIGVLAEFDALSGLSQKAGLTHRELLDGQSATDSGHGCGHNR